jgi:hypothetical protein
MKQGMRGSDLLSRKKPKKRLRKVTPLPMLIKRLDRYFSVWVRSHDAKGDMNECFTCRKIALWRNLQAGHYVKRGHMAVRFDEGNVKPQCARCNLYLRGNMDEFARRIVFHYGAEELERIMKKKWEVKKFTREELEGLIAKYKKLTEGL